METLYFCHECDQSFWGIVNIDTCPECGGDVFAIAYDDEQVMTTDYPGACGCEDYPCCGH